MSDDGWERRRFCSCHQPDGSFVECPDLWCDLNGDSDQPVPLSHPDYEYFAADEAEVDRRCVELVAVLIGVASPLSRERFLRAAEAAIRAAERAVKGGP